MSSSVIRAAARGLPSVVGWPAALPYHDTVSESPSIATLPASWCTFVFQGDTDDPIGIGASQFRETGRVVVACLARSGEGDTTLVALVETASDLIRPHFIGLGIEVHSLTPPQDTDPGLEGEWFRLDVVIDYSRDHA